VRFLGRVEGEVWFAKLGITSLVCLPLMTYSPRTIIMFSLKVLAIDF
jgi:hypothetical protein